MMKLCSTLTFLVLLLCACTKEEPTHTEQCLNASIRSFPSTLDPRKGGDLVSSVFHFLLYDGLFRMNEEGEVVPALAESVDVSDDKLTYTFHLKEAYWSDGTTVSAWDFEQSWKDILSPHFPSMNAHLLYPIKGAFEAKIGEGSVADVGIRSLGDRTLEVVLDRPTPHLFEMMAFCAFFPSHSRGENGRISNGPYRLMSQQRGKEISLVKNHYYHRSNDVFVDQIRFNVIRDEMTSLLLYERGEIDFLGHPLSNFPLDAIASMKEHSDFTTQPTAGTVFTAFNTIAYPFNNKHIRRAFSYAIDRGEIVDAVTQLDEAPALSVIPPLLAKGRERTYFFDYDLKQAKKEFQEGLDELGLTVEEFPKVTYFYSLDETDRKVAQVLQDYWFSAFGVMVELRAMDKPILLHHLKTGTFQFAQAKWMAQYFDPANFFERYTSKDNEKNYSNWENDDYINLIKCTYVAESNEERLSLFDQAERIFLEDMPIIPIFHSSSAFLAKPYIRANIHSPYGNAFLESAKIDLTCRY